MSKEMASNIPSQQQEQQYQEGKDIEQRCSHEPPLKKPKTQDNGENWHDEDRDSCSSSSTTCVKDVSDECHCKECIGIICTGKNDCVCPSCRGGETVKEEYWDGLYIKNMQDGSWSEFLLSYSTLKPFIGPMLGANASPILIPGCGDSPFSAALRDDTNHSCVISTDISNACIQIMEEKHEGDRRLLWLVDDMTASRFQSRSIGQIIDKSLIDCLFWVDDAGQDADVLISRVLSEYYRVLQSHGTVVLVTIRPPSEIEGFLHEDIEHPYHVYEERKQRGIAAEPRSWTWDHMVISVPCDEHGAISFHATGKFVGSNSADDYEDTETEKYFHIYKLQKRDDEPPEDPKQIIETTLQGIIEHIEFEA